MNRTTLPSGREVIDTGRVLIGIRAVGSSGPQAATQDERTIQDLLLRDPPKRMRFVDLVVICFAVVLALLALAYKFGGPV